jgi:hypothetical protein
MLLYNAVLHLHIPESCIGTYSVCYLQVHEQHA